MKLMTTNRPKMLWALVAGTFFLPWLVVQAQDAETVAAVASAEQTRSLWDLIVVGGWAMYPLAFLSVIAVALVIRNFIILQDQKLLRPDLLQAMAGQMARREVPVVRKICDEHPCLLTSVVRAGLERITGETADPDSVTAAMEEASTEQVTVFMAPISYLSIIGGIAPMVGLLGTVSGMIKAFQNIAAGGMGKPEVLAGNIGEALVTTATGLIIAIPAMIFYFYFKHSFMKTMATLGRITGFLMDAFRTGTVPLSTSLETSMGSGSATATPSSVNSSER